VGLYDHQGHREMVRFDHALRAMHPPPEIQGPSSTLTLFTELSIDFWCNDHHLRLRLMAVSFLGILIPLSALFIRASSKSAYRRVIHFFHLPKCPCSIQMRRFLPKLGGFSRRSLGSPRSESGFATVPRRLLALWFASPHGTRFLANRPMIFSQ
jgi:hypothetical protein